MGGNKDEDGAAVGLSSIHRLGIYVTGESIPLVATSSPSAHFLLLTHAAAQGRTRTPGIQLTG